MNEDSVLPDLLPDLLLARIAQLPGHGWGSGGPSEAACWALGGVPDHCSGQHVPPHPEISTKQGLYVQKPFSPWGSAEHDVGPIASFPSSFPSLTLLPA